MRVLVRNLREDEEGVASTVGTLMALLVFLSFLSMIVNQYVPVWMKDSEEAHMTGALGQFGGLKGAIDLQILSSQLAKSDYVPITTSSGVTLGAEGVPIFATPTVGTLSSDADAGPFTVQFDYLIHTPSGADLRTRVREQSNGSIVLDVPNRYNPPQKIVYENGAVIRSQSDGQIIRAQPTFQVTRVNNSLRIGFDIVSLYGSGSASGSSTEVVNSRLFASDLQTYDLFPNNAVIWINHTSPYGLAWFRFFNNTMAGLSVAGTYSSSPLDQSFTARIGALVVYRVTVSFLPALFQYITRVEIHNNPAIMPLASFRLQHAQVHAQLDHLALALGLRWQNPSRSWTRPRDTGSFTTASDTNTKRRQRFTRAGSVGCGTAPSSGNWHLSRGPVRGSWTSAATTACTPCRTAKWAVALTASTSPRLSSRRRGPRPGLRASTSRSRKPTSRDTRLPRCSTSS